MPNNIEILEIGDLGTSAYIKPFRVTYKQNQKLKNWDIVKVHDSVAILLYDKTDETFILVKQFRPAVYLKNDEGYTYELCAGIIDKPKTLEEIACEEVYEECGYILHPDELTKVTSFYTSVGFAGSKQTLYFAHIDNSKKAHGGGGIDIEEIEVVKLSIHEAKAFMYDERIAKTPGLMFAFVWFFDHVRVM